MIRKVLYAAIVFAVALAIGYACGRQKDKWTDVPPHLKYDTIYVDKIREVTLEKPVYLQPDVTVIERKADSIARARAERSAIVLSGVKKNNLFVVDAISPTGIRTQQTFTLPETNVDYRVDSTGVQIDKKSIGRERRKRVWRDIKRGAVAVGIGIGIGLIL